MPLQDWLPPLFTFFGTLIVVLFGVWWSGQMLNAKIGGLEKVVNAKFETLRAEINQGFAELRLEFRTAHIELAQRVKKLEDEKVLVRP